jgi:osmotically inducible protein OsmC
MPRTIIGRDADIIRTRSKDMAEIRRHSSAVWSGTGKEGAGVLSSQSGVLKETPYSANARFGDAKGTNPEELIAAAHAGCFTMALAFRLSAAGHAPTKLETRADLTMTQEPSGWRIASIVLNLHGTVPGVTEPEFLKLAEDAKANCPVSKALSVAVSLVAKLD